MIVHRSAEGGVKLENSERSKLRNIWVGSVCDEACLPALWHCLGGRKDEVQSISYLSSICIFTVVLPIAALNWTMSSRPCTKVSPTPAFSN